MAQQQQNSPPWPQQDERSYQAFADKFDNEGPIDPSIATPSSSYPYPQHSPYGANPDMAHHYSYPSGGMYAHLCPDWGGFGQHGAPLLALCHPMYAHSPASAAQQQRPSQAYSFVPVLGAQQHKRHRRRYEEIERTYNCGWTGCEKSYGTLNNLNAHVTMSSHGSKRTPEEFKEIRKEWKARKKVEENQRNAEEERQRQAARAATRNGDPQGPDGPPISTHHGSRPLAVPPIGYQPTQHSAPPSGNVPQKPMADYPNYMYCK